MTIVMTMVQGPFAAEAAGARRAVRAEPAAAGRGYLRDRPRDRAGLAATELEESFDHIDTVVRDGDTDTARVMVNGQ